MNYNSDLQIKNTRIQALIDKAGNLPEDDIVTIDDISKSIIEGTISKAENSSISTIGAHAFRKCDSLIFASFPACTYIGYDAFIGCSELASINFPACININNNAFEDCSKLSVAHFPACENIGGQAFFNCGNLTIANFPKCISIYESAFINASNLNSISFPVCIDIRSTAFYHCENLASADFPSCSHIGFEAFAFCFSLASASFPACTSLKYGTFRNCSNLSSINFPICTIIQSDTFKDCHALNSVIFPIGRIIGSNAFHNCYRLSSVQLDNLAVCKLSNSNAFDSTPYAGYSAYFSGTPYIYVPYPLLDKYKSATNWVYFSSYFSGIPGSEDWVLPEGITFDIDGTIYQADEGMTWAEWVDSEYNTDEYYADDDGVTKWFEEDDFHFIYGIYYDKEAQTGSMQIISDRSYYLEEISAWG